MLLILSSVKPNSEKTIPFISFPLPRSILLHDLRNNNSFSLLKSKTKEGSERKKCTESLRPTKKQKRGQTIRVFSSFQSRSKFNLKCNNNFFNKEIKRKIFN